jgi:hypothetical protein
VGKACGAFFPGLIWLAAAAGLEPARAAPPSCTPSLTAAADGSFAEAGNDSRPARLSRLAALTRERFVAAARRLCSAGVLRPADVARFGRLIVQNGEGATEPILYQDPPLGRRVFIFQFAFQNGGPPGAAEFERALRCWKYPKKAGCYED